LLSFLVTMIWLASAPGVDRCARPHSRRDPGHARLKYVPTSICSRISPSASSLSRPPVWRHRIKTVLEEKYVRLAHRDAVGPAVLPDLAGTALRSGPRMEGSRPTIPLRC